MNKSKPTDFALALSDFLFRYLPEQKGLSDNSVQSYSDALTLFLMYCESKLCIKREKLTIKDLQRDMVEGFLEWLEKERNNSVSSRNQRRAALNTFFKYLQYKNPGYVLLFQQIKSIPRKNGRTQTVQHLSVEAVTELLRQPDLSLKAERRDFAILSLMYESAARVSEIANLTVGDIRFGRVGTTVYLLGKGRKSREVPLIRSASSFLKRYLDDEKLCRPCLKNEPLFCNRTNAKLTRAGIAYILRKYVIRARHSSPELFPDRVYPHILRHSRAMHWLEAGVDLQYIKDLLGHADLVTTEIYAQLNTDMKRKILETVHPVVLSEQRTPSWSDDKNLMDWLRDFSN
jgi:site-specific recombinase XerD